MTIFASTPPINDDPHPYRVYVKNRVNPARPLRDGERIADPKWVTFWDPETEELIFDPRPEYNRPRAHEANPILLDFRDVLRESDAKVLAGTWLFLLEEDPGMDDQFVWSPLKDLTGEQIDHARRVLTRLAEWSN